MKPEVSGVFLARLAAGHYVPFWVCLACRACVNFLYSKGVFLQLFTNIVLFLLRRKTESVKQPSVGRVQYFYKKPLLSHLSSHE